MSKVLAKAKSVCSACISAAPVATPKELKGLLAIELKSETIEDKSVTPAYGFITDCLFFSSVSSSPVKRLFSFSALLALLLAEEAPNIEPIKPSPAPTTPAITPDIFLFLYYYILQL